MEDRKLTLANSQVGRRLFINRSLTLGLGAGLALYAPTANAATPAVECEPSAADSLLLYIDLLGRVQSEAFSGAATLIGTAAKSCYTTLDALYEKVRLLETELRGTRDRAHARQMREAVEIGKAQVEVVRTTLADSRNASVVLGSTLSLIGEQVNRNAKDLLPRGRITLSAKAKSLLEEVMILVRDFHAVPEETKKATDDHQQRVTEISNLTNKIRDLLFAASSEAADADLATQASVSQGAKTKADQLIDEACANLELLRPKPADPSASTTATGLKSVDILIAVLKGTKQSLGAQSAALRGQGQPQIVPASFDASPSVPASIYSQVQQALETHCPRGTTFRTLHCAALLLGPLAYRDRATRIPLIAGVLVLFKCANRGALASALADI